MQNKTAKTLLAIALGGVAVWIVFRAKEAFAAPEKKITVIPIPEITPPKQPEWYTTAQKAIDIIKQLGGLFKREDQILKEAKETEIARSLGL